MVVIAVKEATKTNVAECWTIDLSDFKSISVFVDRFEKEGGGRLDLLVENAGLVTRKFSTTKDGWESQSVLLSHMVIGFSC